MGTPFTGDFWGKLFGKKFSPNPFQKLFINGMIGFGALCAGTKCGDRPRGALPTELAQSNIALSCGGGAPHGFLLCLFRTEPLKI
jgi:hypothetical protein